MKKIILAISLLAILFSASAYAATSRVSFSKSLTNSYKKPRSTVDGFKDQFAIRGSASNKTYKLKYKSDDAILIVSLQGGTIKSFDIGQAGEVSIYFTSKFSESDGPIRLKLFTSSKMELALNETGFKEAIAGAWFSSTSSTLSGRPLFTDEIIKRDFGHSMFWTQQYVGKSSRNVRDTIHAFFPTSALTFIDSSPNFTFLLRLLSSEWSLFVEAKRIVKDNGLLIKAPVTFSKNARRLTLDISSTTVEATNLN